MRKCWANLDTVLQFTLSSDAKGTQLMMKHSGFKGFELIIVSLIMGRGWKKLIDERLAPVLSLILKEDTAKK
jgi:hypothetical protein